MVEALRCWIEAFQIAYRDAKGWQLTPIGEQVFGTNGLDPYMEDSCTPWTLHWLIASNRTDPFWAWECLFNRWAALEFSSAEVLSAFGRQAEFQGKTLSEVTLKQHWEVFLHTYRPPHSPKGEDHLDSALSCLSLILDAGESYSASGTSEPRYRFNMAEKKTIPQQLFAFFLNDWWNVYHANEATVAFRDVIMSPYSPGRLLKMSEREIVARLQDLSRAKPEIYELTESSNLRQIRRVKSPPLLADFSEAYTSPRFLRSL